MSDPTKLGYRKGFGVQLTKTHWFTVMVGYHYLKSQGQTSPEMDEAAKIVESKLPRLLPSDERVDEEINGSCDYAHYAPGGSKTIRFRAENVGGAVQLLRAGAMCCPHGGAPNTINNRARKLDAVNVQDLLADAGR